MNIEIVFFGKDITCFNRMEEALSSLGRTLIMTRDVPSCKELLSSPGRDLSDFPHRRLFLIIDDSLEKTPDEKKKIKELFSFLTENRENLSPLHALWIADTQERESRPLQEGYPLQGILSKPLSKEVFLFYFQQVSHSFSLLDKMDEQKKLLLTYSKLSSVGEVSMQVAHEVSSPLILLHEQIKQLWKDLQSKIPPRSKDKLIHIDKNCDRIIRILNSLLHLSRGQREIPIKMDVRILINNVLLLFESQFKNKNIVLKVSFPEKMLLVQVGESELTQVLFNLIKNSIEAIENLQEKEPKWISLKVDTKDKKDLHIEVEDSGQGVPKHIQHKIHQSFFTTKATGTGLGLSICQSILKKYGGRLHLDQKAPHTLFRLRLPYANATRTNISTSAHTSTSTCISTHTTSKDNLLPTRQGLPSESLANHSELEKENPPRSWRPLKILVVEDEVDLCKMLAREFTHKGHETFMAFNGLEALEVIYKNKMDILICDLRLPKMSGIDLVKRVRKEFKKGPMVFFMTGGNEHPEMLPSTHILFKPFSLEQISHQVEKTFFKSESLPLLQAQTQTPAQAPIQTPVSPKGGNGKGH